MTSLTGSPARRFVKGTAFDWHVFELSLNESHGGQTWHQLHRPSKRTNQSETSCLCSINCQRSRRTVLTCDEGRPRSCVWRSHANDFDLVHHRLGLSLFVGQARVRIMYLKVPNVVRPRDQLIRNKLTDIGRPHGWANPLFPAFCCDPPFTGQF
jgi:hypothetical protein